MPFFFSFLKIQYNSFRRDQLRQFEQTGYELWRSEGARPSLDWGEWGADDIIWRHRIVRYFFTLFFLYKRIFITISCFAFLLRCCGRLRISIQDLGARRLDFLRKWMG